MDEVKALLKDKRERLVADMAEMSAPPKDTGGISFGKRVGEGTSFAVDRLTQVAAHDGALEVLTQVERSLVKMDEGTYGTCDRCGKPVAPARLEALPWATLCVSCAAQS